MPQLQYVCWIQRKLACALVQGQTLINSSRVFIPSPPCGVQVSEELAPISILQHAKLSSGFLGTADRPWTEGK